MYIKLLKITFLLIFIFDEKIFSHLCHDPFIPQEHLVLIPESKTIKIQNSGEFRIYVENTFRSTLRKVRLIVESSAFDIKVEPEEIYKLVPNERSFYTVKLTLKEDVPEGEYPLKIDATAESAILKPKIEELKVSATKPQQQIILPAVEEEVVEPKEKVPADEYSQKIEKTTTAPVRKSLPDKDEKVIKEKAVPTINEITVKVESKESVDLYLFGIILVAVLTLIFIWRKLKGQ